MMTKLTVVMTVYNGEPYLNLAIESILHQTFNDFIFIIVDNGSTDNTPAILKQYSEQDSRIKLLHNKKNLSYLEGRMIGLEHAATRWVAWMDADDIAAPNRLDREWQFIQEYGEKLGCVGSWAQYIDDNGKVIGNRKTRPINVEQFNSMRENNEAILVTDPSAIIDRELFLQLGGYRIECAPAGDLDLFYRIVEAGKLVLSIPESLLKYRIHANASSVDKFMLQRYKTHYINYNMRQRRLGQPEITLEDFSKNIWDRWSYKFPRLWKDYAKALYKKAGMLYLEKKRIQMFLYLFLASVMWPGYVAQRLLTHKFDKGCI